MYRFFVDKTQIGDQELCIIGQDAHHIKNVLRMHEGEEILVSDGVKKEYNCEILQLGEHEIRAKILFFQESGVELLSKIYLFQCLPKGDKMELIIQKAVELGVYEIVPVASARCVVKLDAKKEAGKLRRWQGISESAAKQSKRMVIPEVHGMMKFTDALKYAQQMDVRLIPYEMEEGMKDTKEKIQSIQKGQSVAVFIGPEGGFEQSEIELAKEAGFSSITLGRRILRTETAGLTTLSILMFYLEE